MNNLQEFIFWSEKIKPEIEHIHSILSQKLSSEPEELISNLQEIEAWNSRAGALLAQANSWLDRYKLIAMPAKEESKSETDRKLQLDKEVAPIRLVRDTLEHFCDSIKQRLILGESILAYFRAQYTEHKSKELEKIY